MLTKTDSRYLYQWNDRLIIANNEKDARRFLREELDVRPTPQFPLEMITRNVDLQVRGESGEPETHSYTATEAIIACGRGMVPEGE
jgi:hypothetical protein